MQRGIRHYITLRSTTTRHINRRGFTIVELLIVIVVIAILATITVVAYNGIQQRAVIAQFQSNLLNERKQVETAYVTDGKYPFEDAARAKLAAGDTNGANYVIQNYFTSDASRILYSTPYTVQTNNIGGGVTDATIDASGRLTWVQIYSLANDNGDRVSNYFIIGSASARVQQSTNFGNPSSMR